MDVVVLLQYAMHLSCHWSCSLLDAPKARYLPMPLDWARGASPASPQTSMLRSSLPARLPVGVIVPERCALTASGKRESRSGGCCTLASQVYSRCLDARSSRDAAYSSLALQCLAASCVSTNASKGSIASHRRLMVIIVTMLRRLHSKPLCIKTRSRRLQGPPNEL